MNFLERLIETADKTFITLSEITVVPTSSPIACMLVVHCVATDRTSGFSKHFAPGIHSETTLYPELVVEWCDAVVRLLECELEKEV